MNTHETERALFERNQVAETVDTVTAAILIGRRPQTLRKWACDGGGALQPIRIGGRLRWSLKTLRELAATGSAPRATEAA